MSEIVKREKVCLYEKIGKEIEEESREIKKRERKRNEDKREK